MENMKKTVETEEIRKETFTSLMRKAEVDEDYIYPLAIAIAYSNLKTAIDPEARNASNKNEVSNSGTDKKLSAARTQLYIASLQLQNILALDTIKTEKKIVKRLDKKSGKFVIEVKPETEATKKTGKEEGEALKALILNQTIDGIGLELVSEIAISLLENKRKYGSLESDHFDNWLERDVTILKPKKTIFVHMDEKIEMEEKIVKPIQLAFRAGANFINRQRAVRDRIADTVLLDMFMDGETEDGEEIPAIVPEALQYVLRTEINYTSVGDVERVNAILEKLNLTEREAQILKWRLDGMNVFVLNEETNKREKIHIDAPSVEVMAAKLGISESTVKRAIASMCEKAEKNGFKPDRIAVYNQQNAVEQIDPENGEVVAVYAGLGEAAKQTGIDKMNINAVLKQKRRRAGGYFWKYASKRENLQTVEENTIREHF